MNRSTDVINRTDCTGKYTESIETASEDCNYKPKHDNPRYNNLYVHKLAVPS